MAGPLGGLRPASHAAAATLRYIFTVAVVAMYVALPARRSSTCRGCPRAGSIAAILAVHVIFLLSPPLTLTDIFNYVNYGRMEVVHHLNPYTTIPVLEPHDDPSFTSATGTSC